MLVFVIVLQKSTIAFLFVVAKYLRMLLPAIVLQKSTLCLLLQNGTICWCLLLHRGTICWCLLLQKRTRCWCRRRARTPTSCPYLPLKFDLLHRPANHTTLLSPTSLSLAYPTSDTYLLVHPLQKRVNGIPLISTEYHSVSMIFQQDTVVLSTVS